jgi:hypothetical protein
LLFYHLCCFSRIPFLYFIFWFFLGLFLFVVVSFLTYLFCRGGKICLTVHFKPLWARNVPHFGIAHALALGVCLSSPLFPIFLIFPLYTGKMRESGRESGGESRDENREARVGRRESGGESREARVGRRESGGESREARVGRRESGGQSREARVESWECARCSPTHLFTHSLAHPLAHPLTHSPTRSPTHPLALASHENRRGGEEDRGK